MATQSLYRRYRPRRFDELRGQEHIVRAQRGGEGWKGRSGVFVLGAVEPVDHDRSNTRKVLNCTTLQMGNRAANVIRVLRSSRATVTTFLNSTQLRTTLWKTFEALSTKCR